MPHKVFICHSSKDKLVADAACAALEAHRIPCWIAPRDIAPGVEWGGAIVDAINDCKVVLLIFSQHANDSPDVRREINLSISEQKDLVPFRIQNVVPTGAIKYAVSNRHWLDAVDPPMEHRLLELSDKIARILNLPAEAEPLWTPNTSGSEALPDHQPPVAVPFWKTRKAIVAGAFVVLAGLAASRLSSKPSPPAPSLYDQAKAAKVQGNSANALLLFIKACDTGAVQACVDLGTMYRTGAGVTVSTDMAGKLYQQACTAGNQDGCNQLHALQNAMNALNGTGDNSPSDKAKREREAKEALEK